MLLLLKLILLGLSGLSLHDAHHGGDLAIVSAKVVEFGPSCPPEVSLSVILASDGSLNDVNVLEQRRVELKANFHAEFVKNVAYQE